MNSPTRPNRLHLSGYYRAADGSLTRGDLSLKPTETGYERLSSGSTDPVTVRRFQSVPGTIDVKFSGSGGPEGPWTFLASADSCEKAGINVTGVVRVDNKASPLGQLNRIAGSIDSAGWMGETPAPEDTVKQTRGLQNVHDSTVELVGEAKRALFLLAREESNSAQVKESVANLTRILSERFGVPLPEALLAKTAQREQANDNDKSTPAATTTEAGRAR